MNNYSKTLLALTIAAMSSSAAAQLDPAKSPSENFDLSMWKIVIPMEDTKPERQGKVMELSKAEVNQGYQHPQWFYTDKKSGAMVFAAPNKAMTTPNSSNARSELHALISDKHDIGPYEPENNFVLASHPKASEFGAIGGKMSATLAVDHVSLSGDHRHNDSFSVVIGQIHAGTNEPLKIFYRKLPDQEYGSVYWNYENNALGEDYHRRLDISHNVFGQAKLRFGQPEPTDGIKLGEKFSYDVQVDGDVMYLEFTKNLESEAPISRHFAIDLAKGQYLGNKYDAGYKNEWFFFKAGAYNQCNTGVVRCTNNGIEAGDYTQASFYKLEIKH
ncbi:polysaccharide lyase family 7 protein [Vibrio sp. YMD68]|uniref:polysaccharide lyase family 7 protein n=1 Tax=Vibrio sp. YMD68 TaxID=3042300 RepID=UPI00249C42ED|nr:polysaccharide lyase family 7 protein [Vibrio sp. YMD68]WGW01215.1 polysaccharide lyase family 7 protein [Vibrio sp. YMD68]